MASWRPKTQRRYSTGTVGSSCVDTKMTLPRSACRTAFFRAGSTFWWHTTSTVSPGYVSTNSRKNSGIRVPSRNTESSVVSTAEHGCMERYGKTASSSATTVRLAAKPSRGAIHDGKRPGVSKKSNSSSVE